MIVDGGRAKPRRDVRRRLAGDAHAGPLERSAVHYVAVGHTNKLVAYTLGIPEGTVATLLKRAARKLGARSRVDLVARWRQLVPARLEPIADGIAGVTTVAPSPSVAEAALSEAERAVVGMVRRGMSNAAIARARGTAVRTVANQLASAFTKLGVRSRTELAARSGLDA